MRAGYLPVQGRHVCKLRGIKGHAASALLSIQSEGATLRRHDIYILKARLCDQVVRRIRCFEETDLWREAHLRGREPVQAPPQLRVEV